VQNANSGDVDLSSLVELFGDQTDKGVIGTAGNGVGVPDAGVGGGISESAGKGEFDIPDMSGGEVGFSGLEGIDLDEYNFNDGMIGVDGDEFESLFAEFK